MTVNNWKLLPMMVLVHVDENSLFAAPPAQSRSGCAICPEPCHGSLLLFTGFGSTVITSGDTLLRYNRTRSTHD